jgi:hypothetical protein
MAWREKRPDDAGRRMWCETSSPSADARLQLRPCARLVQKLADADHALAHCRSLRKSATSATAFVCARNRWTPRLDEQAELEGFNLKSAWDEEWEKRARRRPVEGPNRASPRQFQASICMYAERAGRQAQRLGVKLAGLLRQMALRAEEGDRADGRQDDVTANSIKILAVIFGHIAKSSSASSIADLVTGLIDDFAATAICRVAWKFRGAIS